MITQCAFLFVLRVKYLHEGCGQENDTARLYHSLNHSPHANISCKELTTHIAVSPLATEPLFIILNLRNNFLHRIYITKKLGLQMKNLLIILPMHQNA